MAEHQRVVVAERRPDRIDHRAPDVVVHHLVDGPSINEFQPVKCGGGITLHGPRTKRPVSEVCPDCLNGNVTI